MGAENPIEDYQVEMISNNPNPGILLFTTRYFNNEIKLYYNITSKMAISRFLSKRKLKRNEFIEILDDILNVILESEHLYLNPGSFLLDEEYIFVNPGNLKVSLVYVPVRTDGDINEIFKDFLSKFIIQSATIDENENSDFLQKILNYIKSEFFHINEFHCLLEELKKTNISHRPKFEYQSDSQGMQDTILHKTINPTLKEASESLHLKSTIPSGTEENPLMTIKKNKRLEWPEAKPKKKHSNLKSIIMAAAFQVLMAVVVYAALNYLNKTGDSSTTTYIGLALIVAAVDVLIFKRLLKPEEKERVNIIKSDKNNGKGIENKSLPIQTVTKKRENLNMNKREIHNDEQIRINYAADNGLNHPTEIIGVQNSADTVVLEERKESQAYLEQIKNGIADRIPINKNRLVIGRQAEYVDHVLDNKAVGRIHAEITIEKGCYFITDINSKNGTFINNQKILSNKKYEIKNGDKIKFANEEYTFHSE